MAKLKAKQIPLGERRTCTLVGLPGVRAKEVQAVDVRSITDAMKWLRGGWAVSTAGDEGSVVAWRNDAGILQVQFCRYRVPLSEEKFTSMAAVQRWFKVWWPKMQR